MFDTIANAIDRLRSLDDAHKRRVLMWGSGAIMLVVVALWVGYISLSLETVAETPGGRTTLLQKTEAVAVSFALTTARGARIVSDRILSLLGTDRTINIEDNRRF